MTSIRPVHTRAESHTALPSTAHQQQQQRRRWHARSSNVTAQRLITADTRNLYPGVCDDQDDGVAGAGPQHRAQPSHTGVRGTRIASRNPSERPPVPTASAALGYPAHHVDSGRTAGSHSGVHHGPALTMNLSSQRGDTQAVMHRPRPVPQHRLRNSAAADAGDAGTTRDAGDAGTTRDASEQQTGSGRRRRVVFLSESREPANHHAPPRHHRAAIRTTTSATTATTATTATRVGSSGIAATAAGGPSSHSSSFPSQAAHSHPASHGTISQQQTSPSTVSHLRTHTTTSTTTVHNPSRGRQHRTWPAPMRPLRRKEEHRIRSSYTTLYPHHSPTSQPAADPFLQGQGGISLYQMKVHTAATDLREVRVRVNQHEGSSTSTPWYMISHKNVGLVLPYNKPLSVLAPKLQHHAIPAKQCAFQNAGQLTLIVYLLSDLAGGRIKSCDIEGTDTKSKSVHDLTVELSDLFGNAHWSFSAVVPDETPKAATGKSHSSGQKKRSLTQRVGPFGGDAPTASLSKSASFHSPYTTKLQGSPLKRQLSTGADASALERQFREAVHHDRKDKAVMQDKSIGTDELNTLQPGSINKRKKKTLTTRSSRTLVSTGKAVSQSHTLPQTHEHTAQGIAPLADDRSDDRTHQLQSGYEALPSTNQTREEGPLATQDDSTVIPTCAHPSAGEQQPLPADSLAIDGKPSAAQTDGNNVTQGVGLQPSSLPDIVRLTGHVHKDTGGQSSTSTNAGASLPSASEQIASRVAKSESMPPLPATSDQHSLPDEDNVDQHDSNTSAVAQTTYAGNVKQHRTSISPAAAQDHGDKNLHAVSPLPGVTQCENTVATENPPSSSLLAATTEHDIERAASSAQSLDARVSVPVTTIQDKLRAQQRHRRKNHMPAQGHVGKLQRIAGEVVYEQWKAAAQDKEQEKKKVKSKRRSVSRSRSPSKQRWKGSSTSSNCGDSDSCISLPERRSHSVRAPAEKRKRLPKQLSEDPSMYKRRRTPQPSSGVQEARSESRRTSQHNDSQNCEARQAGQVENDDNSTERGTPMEATHRLKSLAKQPQHSSNMICSLDGEFCCTVPEDDHVSEQLQYRTFPGRKSKEKVRTRPSLRRKSVRKRSVRSADLPSAATSTASHTASGCILDENVTPPLQGNDQHTVSQTTVQDMRRQSAMTCALDMNDVCMDVTEDAAKPLAIYLEPGSGGRYVVRSSSPSSSPMSESKHLAGFESDDSLSETSPSDDSHSDSVLCSTRNECMKQIHLVKNISSTEGYPYLIFVQTDRTSRSASGSTGVVCLAIVGENGCSEEIALSRSLSHDEKFSRGQTDAFHIRLRAPLGEVFYILISYLTPKFFQPRWCLNSVYIIDETDQWQFEFTPKMPILFGWSRSGIMKALRGQQNVYTMSCRLNCDKKGTTMYQYPGKKSPRKNDLSSTGKEVAATPWVRALFEFADKNEDGTLIESEIIAMARRLNMSAEAVAVFLKNLEDSKQIGLDLERFSAVWRHVENRGEIEEVFERFSSNQIYLTEDDWNLFLSIQGEEKGISLEDAILKYEPYLDEAMPAGALTLNGFRQYITSDACDIWDDECCKFRRQDMDHPLSHYYIASSHNTYLVADQIKGPTTEQGYARALRSGCRCVELDCFDGDGQPVIKHGRTPTQPLNFRQALLSIREHAFFTSPYPVILSFENHCSVPMQEKMAQELLNVFGDKLYLLPPDKDSEFLPSPEKLKGKILIKNKKLNDAQESRPVFERADTTQAGPPAEPADQRRGSLLMVWRKSDAGQCKVNSGKPSSPVSAATARLSTESPDNISISIDGMYADIDTNSCPIGGGSLLTTSGSFLESESDCAIQSLSDSTSDQRHSSSRDSYSSYLKSKRELRMSRLSTLDEGISYRSVDIGDDKSGISGDDGDSQFPGMREHRNGRTPSDDMSPTNLTKFPYHRKTSGSKIYAIGSGSFGSSSEGARDGLRRQSTIGATDQSGSTNRPSSPYLSSLDNTMDALSGSQSDLLLLNKLEAEISRQNSINNRPVSPSKSLDATQTKDAKSQKVAKELSIMVNIIQPVKFTTLKAGNYWEMSSIKENTLNKLLSSSSTCEQMAEHTKRQIIRVYPAGHRIDSSNLNPVTGWNCGTQMVALNYQTPGVAMDLNRAMFTQNGNCGLVLKPEFLREQDRPFNCVTNTPSAYGVEPKCITIRMISGHQLPNAHSSSSAEVISPVVCIDILGLPCDRQEFRTKQVNQNGFQVPFGETAKFTVSNPVLAFVRFSVLDCGKPDRCVGQLTLPFSAIQQGFRNVNLQSQTGHRLPGASLFVHITINTVMRHSYSLID